MHGIRLDSDVEDTPDKQGCRQLERARGSGFQANRESITDTVQEKAVSPGSQLLAGKVVRRSRLRLASKSSASVPANTAEQASQQLALGPNEDTAIPRLSSAQQGPSVTPKRPRPPHRLRGQSTKPKARDSPPLHVDNGTPQEHASSQQRSSDAQGEPAPAMLPAAATGAAVVAGADDEFGETHSQGSLEPDHCAQVAVPGSFELAAADAAVGQQGPKAAAVTGGSAAVATTTAAGGGNSSGPKKCVQTKLHFFAPQVHRAGKEAKVEAVVAPLVSTIPDEQCSTKVEPAKEQQQLRQDQQLEEEEEPDGNLRQRELPVSDSEPVSKPSETPAFEGPVPVVDHVDLTEADGAAEPAAMIAGPGSSSGTADAAGSGTLGAGKHLHTDLSLRQGHPTVTLAAARPASRARRQALLPGASLPVWPAVPLAVAAVPAAGDAASPAQAGEHASQPQAVWDLSPVKTRQRGSHTGEPGPAASGAALRGRGAGRARSRARAGRSDGVASAAAQDDAPEHVTAGAMLDDTVSSVNEGTDGIEEEYQPTRPRRPRASSTRASSAAGVSASKGHGTRGGARGRGRSGIRKVKLQRDENVTGDPRVGQSHEPSHCGDARSAAAPDGVPASVLALDGGLVSTIESGMKQEGSRSLAAVQLIQGECKEGGPVTLNATEAGGVATKEFIMITDEANEKQSQIHLDGGGNGNGGSDSGTAPSPQTAKAAGPAKPTGPVSEMFLSVAERKRRQKQRQEEASAQRQAAGEREKQEAEERLRAREREGERPRPKAPAAASESIDVSASPTNHTAPPVPVNPFFRLRKRAGGEAGAAVKLSPNGDAAGTAGGGVGSAAGAWLPPALAPVHVQQFPKLTSDCDCEGGGAVGVAATSIAAAASCLLQVDGEGAMSLMPSDEPPSRPRAVAASAVKNTGSHTPLSFSFLRPLVSPQPSHPHMQSCRQFQAVPMQGKVCSVEAGIDCIGMDMPGGGGMPGAGGAVENVKEERHGRGGGGGSAVPLLQELATYLAETQRQENAAGVSDGGAEVELLDLPSKEDILRQLTNELSLRRRRITMPPPLPQQQPRIQSQQAGAPIVMGGIMATTTAAAAAVVAPGAPGPAVPPREQLWCTAQQPLCAAELCGNAEQVGRLRDWLQSWREVIMLEGQRRAEGVSGPRKARGRRRSELSSESYMTDSDGSDWEARSAGGTADSDGERRGGGGGGGDGDGDAKYKGLPTALVLRGPSGCGKTAAAYAVASELGFRVLEVNPSFDRSGPQLLRMVGEATKSRRLVQSLAAVGGAGHALPEVKGGATAAAAAPARAARRGRNPGGGGRQGGGAGGRTSRRNACGSSATSGPSSPSPSPLKRQHGVFRRGGATAAARLFISKDTAATTGPDQAGGGAAAATATGTTPDVNGACGGSAATIATGSATVMLFDEVDVLPEEDKGFIGALVSIIQQSKRPIILTAGRGQLLPALRALGLQELHFKPASVTELLRTVTLACAVTGSKSTIMPRPLAKQAFVNQNVSAVIPGVLDLSVDDDDCDVGTASGADAADAVVTLDPSEFRGSTSGCELRQPLFQPPPAQPGLLPSLLNLVRSCHGDLRHALLEVQFWLGSHNCSSGGGGDAGCSTTGQVRLPYWAGRVDGEDTRASQLSSKSSALIRVDCDGCEEEYGSLLEVARNAVEEVAEAAAAALVEGTVGTGLRGTCMSDDSSHCLSVVLPHLRLWLPDTMATAAALPAPGSDTELPLNSAVTCPAARHMQWQSYEARCKRMREQQLAARWLELEVARAAVRTANRRPCGPAGRHLTPEAEPTMAPSVNMDDGNGDAEAVDPADAADDRNAGDDAQERASSQTDGSLEQKEETPVSQLLASTGLSAVPESNSGQKQQQQYEKEEENRPSSGQALQKRTRQMQDSDGDGTGFASGAMEEGLGRGHDAAPGSDSKDPPVQKAHTNRQQEQQQQFPQKRRASEVVEVDVNAIGAGSGEGGVSSACGGAKRTRLSHSCLGSRAATPMESLPAMSPEAGPAAVAAGIESDAAGTAVAAEVSLAAVARHEVLLPSSAEGMDAAAQVTEPGDAAEAYPDGPAHLDLGSLEWLVPVPPPLLSYNAAALVALTAPLPPPLPPPRRTGVTATPPALVPEAGPFQVAVRACRVQAALAEMYNTLSELDVLAMPRDAFVSVSGPCPPRHYAAYATVRPLGLGMNMTLQPPPLLNISIAGMTDSTAWVMADAVRDQEDMPGRVLAALAADAEAIGLGAGEPAGPLGQWTAAEAVASAARLAAAVAVQIRSILPQSFPVSHPEQQQQEHQRQNQQLMLLELRDAGSLNPPQPYPHVVSQPTAWQLSTVHGALQAVAPGCCAGSSTAAMDRLAALASICRSETVRQHREARRAKWVRRAPMFCHYLSSLHPQHLAALHHMSTAFGAPRPEAQIATEEATQQEFAANEGLGSRLRRRAW